MKVVCKICGREFSTLNSHMHRTHGITIEEYKKLYPCSKTCSEEFLDKQSKAMTKRNVSHEFSESISKRNSENWKRKEYRESQVLSMIKKRNHSIIGNHYSDKCLSFVAYKSIKELNYAKMLDENVEVVSYDSESFAIWYNFNGKDKMYVPDFIVNYKDGHTEVVEIKPQVHHSAHDDLLDKKFIAAKCYCESHGYKFVVVKG